MKKNITINLFGSLYAIDEDACKLLEQYLDNMKRYFSQREDGDEIVDDIEHRVAEIFTDMRAEGIQAINIDHVRDIIHRIGNPEEMDDETQAAETEMPHAETADIQTVRAKPRMIQLTKCRLSLLSRRRKIPVGFSVLKTGYRVVVCFATPTT